MKMYLYPPPLLMARPSKKNFYATTLLTTVNGPWHVAFRWDRVALKRLDTHPLLSQPNQGAP